VHPATLAVGVVAFGKGAQLVTLAGKRGGDLIHRRKNISLIVVAQRGKRIDRTRKLTKRRKRVDFRMPP
jgi:hypothetical protein